MPPPFKASPSEYNQHALFPSNIFMLLPEDHECPVYKSLFEQIDTSALEDKYSYIGQNAYHPKLIVSILIYAYSRGVYSSREIEKRCNEDLSFMLIAEKNCPNFRVLSDFRQDNTKFFHDCFKQTVKLALELKLASLGHISLDGSKFKANSSKHKAMSYKRLKEQEKRLSAEIDELVAIATRCDEEENQAYREKTGYEIPEDLKHKEGRLEKIKAAKAALEEREESLYPGKKIEDKKQISFADTDARIMGKKGNFDYRYNGQISVDADNQIIVGQHVSQHANDTQEVTTALDGLKEAAGKLPERMSLDNGYMSGGNLDSLNKETVDAYIATNKGEKSHKETLDESDRKLVKADFNYDEEQDYFTCPGEQQLRVVIEGKEGSKTYQGSSEGCNACSYQPRCCGSKKGEARRIKTDDKEGLRRAMNAKMEEEKSKEIYKERKVIVEPVFGQIKNRGFLGFSLRGKEKVAGEFSLVCATHNMKKIVGSMLKGLVRPEVEKMAISQA
ncbi:Transposase, IS4 family [hydrothermal vent metagenome]|uniref:Transposase, IS4 family n=1 Tax=hydrothermal vent metagenome TaxID=652676 RepID=A0A3B0WYP7_9ZZZZ